MRLDEGWNQIQFNLSDFTRRAYGTNYIETLRVQIHANCRIRRIYFSDRLYSEEELPPEFKLFLPIQVRRRFHPPCALPSPLHPCRRAQGHGHIVWLWSRGGAPFLTRYVCVCPAENGLIYFKKHTRPFVVMYFGFLVNFVCRTGRKHGRDCGGAGRARLVQYT